MKLFKKTNLQCFFFHRYIRNSQTLIFLCICQYIFKDVMSGLDIKDYVPAIQT